jgi:hypothetical protein
MRVDTSRMLTQLFTGLIVGFLIGLAVAPFLRAWIEWRQIHEVEKRER